MTKSGILLLAKSAGSTSFRSLNQVKRALDTKKVGHSGTLDLFAEGLLVVAVGSCTKIIEDFTLFDKEYEAVIQFGTETDTLDPQGQIVKTVPSPTKEVVLQAMSRFVGEINQVPPQYSAIHVDGKRASDLARSGKMPEMRSRKVKIYSFEMKDFYENFAHVKVSCSKGTYIRSLARDLAEKCGSAGHLKALRRTKIGPFALENACGANLLPPFSIENALADKVEQTINLAEIPDCLMVFTPEISEKCGAKNAFLHESRLSDFLCGKKLKPADFAFNEGCDGDFNVFCGENFVGKIHRDGKKVVYRFVIPEGNR